MSSVARPFKSGNQISNRSILIWRIVQTIFWLAGVCIFLCLIFFPAVGLLIFWNILIPVAPVLLVIEVGFWRNICPLAITNLLPRHFNLSQKKIMPVTMQAKLQLVAVIALYTIVPLRHFIFNNNGNATALLLAACVATGISMGFIYEWKSGWCSTLCPVHPVEKMYGGNTLISLPNAHCSECVNCSIPCPDSTPAVHPGISTKTTYNKISGILTIGGLPGFIWGWFHVPDQTVPVNQFNFMQIYAMPLTGLCLSLLVFLLLKNYFKDSNERLLINVFAATSVSFYYWYRIPALLGFGKFADDGLLLNLKNDLPEWSITVIIITTTIFFFYWFLFKNTKPKSWVLRPQFAANLQNKNN